MKKILAILLFVVPCVVIAQDCDCESNYNWVKNTFEENDAGFSYVIDSKGQEAYEAHNARFNEKVKHADNKSDCVKLIRGWLSFFRSGHIDIRIIQEESDTLAAEQLGDENINDTYADWEQWDVDLDEFQSYLSTKTEIDYEGIWQSGPYKIGIKKKENQYVGFIIEADGVYWKKDQIKLRINPDQSCVYYMQDHSEQIFEKAELWGNNLIVTGFIILNRIAPEYETDPKYERYLKVSSAREAYFEKIDDETLLLRIPSFSGTEKNQIDSVIWTNKNLLLKTPNLIIDIRDNGGGSDRSYAELLPILYTNEIRTVGVEMFSTPLNNQRMLDFISDPKYAMDEENKIWAQMSYDKLSKQLGEFVILDSLIVDKTIFDTIYPFPKNIAILINQNNGSTAEQFLLAANQSKKVKLFGTTTAGVLDISNMYYIPTPCNEYMFGYSLSRSMRIPEMTIDDKGIQPDYYIDQSIPKYEWIDFAKRVIKE